MRSGTTARAFVLDRVVPPLKGLNKYIDYYYPGLAPWAMQECRPKGLILAHVILLKQVRRTRFSKYEVNTFVSTLTYRCECAYLNL